MPACTHQDRYDRRQPSALVGERWPPAQIFIWQARCCTPAAAPRWAGNRCGWGVAYHGNWHFFPARVWSRPRLLPIVPQHSLRIGRGRWSSPRRLAVTGTLRHGPITDRRQAARLTPVAPVRALALPRHDPGRPVWAPSPYPSLLRSRAIKDVASLRRCAWEDTKAATARGDGPNRPPVAP